ncbi:MAG: glycosyltransferase family 1 protein [bacterium]|nr:glycosyltransferase family 1 protein [bacterium]
MRIGIDGRPLQEKFGGVKEYTLNLLHALFCLDKKNEYHIFYNFFKSPFNSPFDQGGSQGDFTQYPNVQIHNFHWPNKLLNLSLRLFNCPKLNKLIFQNYQLPTTNYQLDLFYLPNLNFAAFSKNFKYIVTVHDLSFHHFPYFYSLKQQLWHKALNYKRLLSQATKIITVSRHTRNDLMETFGLPREKIDVVYPCLSNPPQSPFDKGGSKDGFILYLGTLEPRKNIESLIEAYKILKKSPSNSPFVKGGSKGNFPKLVIAGPKGWRYKNIFKAAEKEPGIIFLGQVNKEEKKTLYQNAKLFVFPSFYEGFGLPPLEAASHGVPIIASTASSLPEVLDEAAFYVNSWNVNELVQAIDFLLSNENERQKLSQAGLAQAAKFQNQQSAEKLLRIFEEVAK